MPLEFEEYFAYDRVEVSTHINAAIEIVDKLDVPHDLRVAAFERAVALLSQKQRVPKVPEALRGIAIPPNHG